ncbi:MAG: aspartate aminotransferase family protein [Dehalococcoidia bacterium]|nr:aspartate aminotransferase family protein [Dehalococcoidia bacterium]
MTSTTTASRSRAYQERAAKVFGGGTLSIWTLPDDVPVILTRGQGAQVWDVDGREFVDYHMGSGPMLLGHCHPGIVAAVQEQLARGSQFHMISEQAVEFAERVVDAVPCAEAIKFTSSGTEATFYALRLARVATGRRLVLKFEGALHGSHDYAVQSTAPPTLSPYPRGIPDSDGIPTGASESVLIAEFNDLAGARDIVERHGKDLAAIIVEPLQRALVPQPGFLAGLRTLADTCGALLVFDEIVTGFRLAWGGAQERYDVTPDLCTLGKAFAGGFPVAAICGRRDVLDLTHASRRGQAPYAWVGGTFNGNPIGATAGLAALEALAADGVYDRLHQLGNTLRAGLNALGEETGLPMQAIGDGPVSQVFFGTGPLQSYRDTLATDQTRRMQFGNELLRRGILVNPGEKLYLSLAHSDADLDQFLSAARGALQALH